MLRLSSHGAWRAGRRRAVVGSGGPCSRLFGRVASFPARGWPATALVWPATAAANVSSGVPRAAIGQG
eukprot:5888444-Lingulodinium_polyedra.AAC.1